MSITFNYSGKTVIVTGCASGIGRAIAVGYGSAGANVVVADINSEGGKETVRIIQDNNGNAVYIPLDVTDEESVSKMVNESIDTYGKVDILINNAGVVGSIKGYPLTGMTSEDWDKNYKINLRGLFYSCKKIYDIFKNQNHGKIVNVASISGKTGDKTDLALMEYSCMKSAAIHFTQLLSKELGPYNINVNCICPGFVYTALYENAAPLLQEKYPEILPKELTAKEVVEKFSKEWCALERSQTPEDMANAVMFLTSDEAQNITGQAINVCGGCESH